MNANAPHINIMNRHPSLKSRRGMKYDSGVVKGCETTRGGTTASVLAVVMENMRPRHALCTIVPRQWHMGQLQVGASLTGNQQRGQRVSRSRRDVYAM